MKSNSSYSANAKNVAKLRKKEKKVHSTLRYVLHRQGISITILVAFEICFTIFYLVMMRYHLFHFDKRGTPLLTGIIFARLVVIDALIMIIFISRTV